MGRQETRIALHYGYGATTAPQVSVRYILARRFSSRSRNTLTHNSAVRHLEFIHKRTFATSTSQRLCSRKEYLAQVLLSECLLLFLLLIYYHGLNLRTYGVSPYHTHNSRSRITDVQVPVELCCVRFMSLPIQLGCQHG